MPVLPSQKIRAQDSPAIFEPQPSRLNRLYLYFIILMLADLLKPARVIQRERIAVLYIHLNHDMLPVFNKQVLNRAGQDLSAIAAPSIRRHHDKRIDIDGMVCIEHRDPQHPDRLSVQLAYIEPLMWLLDPIQHSFPTLL